jgi:hypothetical protein
MYLFTNDIYLFLSYIIPSTSSYVHQSDDDVLENIEKDISLKYRGRGDIILCGDLNARWGSEPDFIQNDSHLPIYDSYICDKVHEVRKSYDSKLDTRGKQLLELCITARMRILNGRMLGDSNGTEPHRAFRSPHKIISPLPLYFRLISFSMFSKTSSSDWWT